MVGIMEMEVNEVKWIVLVDVYVLCGVLVVLGVEVVFVNMKLFLYWFDNLVVLVVELVFVGDVMVDLLIVGGGFMGLWLVV